MASDITLLKSFVNGQGAGASAYQTYAEDHDTNYTIIEATINAINAEIRAIGGQNAPLVLELLTSLSSPTIATGFVDDISFQPVTFLSADTQIQIPRGVALTVAGRIAVPTTTLLTGSGTSGTRYVALRTDGTITLETATAQGVMDLYSVDWTGSAFTTATLARLEEILPAGHDFQNLKVQEDYGQGSDSAIPAFTYDRIADRISDIVRIMGANLTSVDSDQAALNPMAFGGSVGTPGFIPGDGSTHDVTSGFYRPGADQIGVSIGATQAGLWAESVANEPGYRMRAGTSLATPPLTFVGDLDSGIGWISADIWRLIAGGVEVLRLFESGSNPQALLPLGTSGVPSLGFIGDPDSGVYSPGADRLALMTNAIDALEINANQQRVSATQGRSSASNATFSLANNAITAVNLDTEQYDVGTYHDTGVNPDRMTVPTGHGGLFALFATVEFDESTSAGTPNAGDRGIAITVNGTAVPGSRCPAAAAGDSELSTAIDVNLSAGDIVRVTAFQDSGGAMDISARLTVRHAE